MYVIFRDTVFPFGNFSLYFSEFGNFSTLIGVFFHASIGVFITNILAIQIANFDMLMAFLAPFLFVFEFTPILLVLFLSANPKRTGAINIQFIIHFIIGMEVIIYKHDYLWRYEYEYQHKRLYP